MKYQIQYASSTPYWWNYLKADDKPMIFDTMEEAVLKAAKQAASFHSFKYRVVEFQDPEVIMTLQGGTHESS